VTISRAAPAGRSGARAFAHQEPYRAPVSADPSEGTEPHTPQERPEEPRLELEPHASIPCHLAARFLAHFGRRECCGRGGRRRSLPASRPAVWRVAQTGGANGPRGGRFDALAALRSALPSKGARSPTETIPHRRRKCLPGSEPEISTCRREPSASAKERPGTFGALIGRSLQTV
jgi:hypothetical protein